MNERSVATCRFQVAGASVPPIVRGERYDGGAVERLERAGAVRGGECAHRLPVGAAGARGGGAGEERIGCVGNGSGGWHQAPPRCDRECVIADGSG